MQTKNEMWNEKY